jgi:hypothetical protein
MEDCDASSKLAWLCVGRKSCSSGEDRDKSQVCARHKQQHLCAQFMRKKELEEAGNNKTEIRPKVKFLQIHFLIRFRCKCCSTHVNTQKIFSFAWKRGEWVSLIFILSSMNFHTSWKWTWMLA